MPKKEIITKKHQVQEVITKNIPPHLKKVDNIQVPRNEERNTIVPLPTMTGKSQPTTLKLKVVTKDRHVMVLVDFDNNHNYIDIDVAKKLNHFVHPTKELIVIIVEGKMIKRVGRCHRVSTQIQELKLQTGFYALPLDKMDILLGGKWLMHMGTYITNLGE